MFTVKHREWFISMPQAVREVRAGLSYVSTTKKVNWLAAHFPNRMDILVSLACLRVNIQQLSTPPSYAVLIW